MPVPIGSTALHGRLTLAIPFFATAWLVTVPAVLTPATFFAVMGLLLVFGWVAKVTYQNGQAADSLPQLLHETECTGLPAHQRDTR